MVVISIVTPWLHRRLLEFWSWVETNNPSKVIRRQTCDETGVLRNLSVDHPLEPLAEIARRLFEESWGKKKRPWSSSA